MSPIKSNRFFSRFASEILTSPKRKSVAAMLTAPSLGRAVGGVVALALMCLSGTASAATATGTLTVSATVLSACTVTGSSLAFGSYTSAQLDASATVNVVCTNGTPYNVGMDAGTGTGATTSVRKMTGSVAGTLSYALYKDSSHTTNWGNTVGTDTATGNGSGISQVLNVYGRISSGQNANIGAYSDTITITLTY